MEAVDYTPGEPGRRAPPHRLYHDTTGQERQLDADSPGPKELPATARPGVDAESLASGPPVVSLTARRPASASTFHSVRHRPPGSHYHPTGKAGNDVTIVGLYFFARPSSSLHWNNATSYDFRLPAGNESIEGRWRAGFVPVDVEVLAVSPHMHLLGRDMLMSGSPAFRQQQELDQDRRLGSRLADRLLFPDPDIARHATHRVSSASKSSHTSTTPPTRATPTGHQKLVKVGPNAADEMQLATSPW